jgi:hypothetical protein
VTTQDAVKVVPVHKWFFPTISALGAKIQILDIALRCLRFKSGARRISPKNPYFWADTNEGLARRRPAIVFCQI